MTVEQLKAFPGVAEHWPHVSRPIQLYLIARMRGHARASKCTIETAQAESAVQKEIEKILSDLETLGIEGASPTATPRMTPLHSEGEPTD